MRQYEEELEKKSNQVVQMEAEQQQIVQENSHLSHQLYVLKTKLNADGKGADANTLLTSDEEKIDRIQKDQMVQLLKRNHDVLMEKCELFRAQNQQAEKVALEKERLYNDMKMDADKAASDLFKAQKYNEELKNLNEILEAKLKKSDEGNRAKDEQVKTLKIQKDKYQGQAKVHGEQLDVIQNSHDELATKKTNEIDMLSKEINQLTLKEKDVR